jgi:hypothetical protein
MDSQMDFQKEFIYNLKQYIIDLIEANISKNAFNEFKRIFIEIDAIEHYMCRMETDELDFESLENMSFSFIGNVKFSFNMDNCTLSTMTLLIDNKVFKIIQDKKVLIKDLMSINKIFTNYFQLKYLNIKNLLIIPLFYAEGEPHYHNEWIHILYENFNTTINNHLKYFVKTESNNFLYSSSLKTQDKLIKISKNMAFEKFDDPLKIQEFKQYFDKNIDVDNITIDDKNGINDINISINHENDFYMHVYEANKKQNDPVYLKNLKDDLDEYFPDLQYLTPEDMMRFMTYPISKYKHDKLVKRRIEALFALKNILIPKVLKRYIVYSYI